MSVKLDADRFDPRRIPFYQNGAEGFFAFVEENVRFEIEQKNGLKKWLYPTELSDEKNPETGKSFKDFWELQKAEVKPALEMKDGKFKYKVIVLCWPRGDGKCQEKGSPVLMFDGTIKKVEEVVVGDLLMGDDSTPREVLALANGYEICLK